MLLVSPQQLKTPPSRIISLVPSQTELLHWLGLETETVGITKFCIHPAEWFRNKIRVGGTKTIDIQKIRDLKPDLIIANKEENVKEQVESLAAEWPVWLTDVNTLEEALNMIHNIGDLTRTSSIANELITQIKNQFENTQLVSPLPAAYLIWREPYMTVGADTFISDMMLKAGFNNVFDSRSRYPEITVQDIKHSSAEFLMLSSEPYPFKQSHITELQHHLPDVKIVLVDGEMFSWYGSRLLLAPAYFQQLRRSLTS
jgi:ABC-type Fe3+-hydroxamate transport system substrate-binding protein